MKIPKGVVNLNTKPVRIAIQHILWEITGEKPSLNVIRIKDNELLRINGRNILRLQRHYHSDNKDENVYDTFRYLQSVEEFLKGK